MSSTELSDIELLANREYKYGFVTDIETDEIPKGLSEDIIRLISKKKEEPEFMLEWRLKAYRHWLTLEEPTWPNLKISPVNYQDIIYYSAPKQAKKLQSLDEVDPELRNTFEKLGISLDEQKRLSNVAVDAVFDSVSVATSFKGKLSELGIIFCSFSEAVKRASGFGKKIYGFGCTLYRQFLCCIKFRCIQRWLFLLYPQRGALSYGALDLFQN